MKGYKITWEVSDCGDSIEFDSYYTIDPDKANAKFESWKENWRTTVESVYNSFNVKKISYTFKTGDVTRGKQKLFWASNGIITYHLQYKIIDIDA